MNENQGSAVSVDDTQPSEQVDLNVDVRRVGDEALEISYDVTNRGAEPIVLVNFVQRPVAETERDADRVFIEPIGDAGVKITQRAWVDDPPSSVPPLHRMVLVEPDASVSNEFSVGLPLRNGDPRPGTSAPQLPNPPKSVQLCLAYITASRLDAAVLERVRNGAGELHPVGPALPGHQTMLCSQVQPLD